MKALTIGVDKDGNGFLYRPAPDVVYFADELLESRSPFMQVMGSNILFTLVGEQLRYVIIGRSEREPNAWIAERVEEFPS